ncbi:phage tail assembly chaperone [Pseudomonas sp. GR 6-02]|uniref:phage tail assembly chaperone n=1 Tax=Pseudomonas sp. GR 6-02 TaxID=1659194 RepID=UPI0007DD7586|nr:phage tail assembly chaperone [Pseudomonas sp. GR 6-02]ANI62156.1 hypothetical protein PGR6_45830 [Pseudomonas sp. GR 6-02]
MIVFSYHFETFEYVGIGEAYESPLEPGVFPLPANSTTVEPPAFNNETQICKWSIDTQAWVVTDRPVQEPEPGQTPEEILAAKKAAMRGDRTGLLYASDWMLRRHQDELLAGATPTLTASKLKAVLDYRQALRDLPTADGFPECSLPVLTWPTSP